MIIIICISIEIRNPIVYHPLTIDMCVDTQIYKENNVIKGSPEKIEHHIISLTNNKPIKDVLVLTGKN
jgi:hypothetical protein